MLLLVVVVIWFDCCYFCFAKIKNAQTRKGNKNEKQNCKNNISVRF